MIKYIEIEDAPELWDNVRDSVIKSVPVAEFDAMLDAGYIDLDGKVLVELDFSDD